MLDSRRPGVILLLDTASNFCRQLSRTESTGGILKSTTQPDPESQILARINGRLEAEQLLQLRKIGTGVDYNQAFARAMRDYADSVLGKPESSVRAMDNKEAAAFESTAIKYGRHQGRAYSQIPIGYLPLLADESLKLAAYLRSDRGRARIEEAG